MPDVTYEAHIKCRASAQAQVRPGVVMVKAEPSIDVLDVLDRLYPVGSVYISVLPVDPAALFGGAWERVKDAFLLAGGDTWAAGTTGGEAQHRLTVDELPSHTHPTLYYSISSQRVGNSGGSVMAVTSANTKDGITGSTGEHEPHNNMPPYIAVYMWKRVA